MALGGQSAAGPAERLISRCAARIFRFVHRRCPFSGRRRRAGGPIDRGVGQDRPCQGSDGIRVRPVAVCGSFQGPLGSWEQAGPRECRARGCRQGNCQAPCDSTTEGLGAAGGQRLRSDKQRLAPRELHLPPAHGRMRTTAVSARSRAADASVRGGDRRLVRGGTAVPQRRGMRSHGAGRARYRSASVRMTSLSGNYRCHICNVVVTMHAWTGGTTQYLPVRHGPGSRTTQPWPAHRGQKLARGQPPVHWNEHVRTRCSRTAWSRLMPQQLVRCPAPQSLATRYRTGLRLPRSRQGCQPLTKRGWWRAVGSSLRCWVSSGARLCWCRWWPGRVTTVSGC